MLRFTVLLLVVSATLAIRYPIKDISERTDAEGQTWVGPIRLCQAGVSDQQLNDCVAENIELIKPTLLKGFPVLKKYDYELKIGPVDIKLALRDLKVQEISEFRNLALTFNTANKTVRFAFEVQNIVVSAFYKAGGTAVIIPIRGSGPAIVKLANLKWTGYLPLSVVTRQDGVDVLQMERAVTDEFKFDGMRIAVQGLFSKTPALSEAFHQFVNSYGTQIFDILMKDQLVPAIGKVVADEIVNPFIYNTPQLAAYLQ